MRALAQSGRILACDCFVSGQRRKRQPAVPQGAECYQRQQAEPPSVPHSEVRAPATMRRPTRTAMTLSDLCVCLIVNTSRLSQGVGGGRGAYRTGWRRRATLSPTPRRLGQNPMLIRAEGRESGEIHSTSWDWSTLVPVASRALE